MKNSIEISNISKHYTKSPITYKRFDSIFSDLLNWSWKREKPDVHIALDDINLKVSIGESVGIIGRNGAGKSTLLKLISGVSRPTNGCIKVSGRISSLLEVGTGFHPELSARENIFLNGVLLGMSRAEIRSKFDDIVSYAGLENFIDTPVKKFSSGMYVRLGFSIAVQLDSDILILDEVLAVGDMGFQKQCFDTISGIMGSKSRTILFVSHNLATVSEICHRSVLLDEGQLVADGKTSDVISVYRDNGGYKSFVEFKETASCEHCLLTYAALVVDDKIIEGIVEKEASCYVTIEFEVVNSVVNVLPFVGLYNSSGILVWVDKMHAVKEKKANVGINKVAVKLPTVDLLPGEYDVEIGLGIPAASQFLGLDTLIFQKDALRLILVESKPLSLDKSFGVIPGVLSARGEWSFL